MFVSEAEPGVAQDIVLGAGRQAYIVCIENSLTVATSDAGKLACAGLCVPGPAKRVAAAAARLHCAAMHAAAVALLCTNQSLLACQPPPPPTHPALAETRLEARDAAELVADKKPLYLTLTAGDKGAHFMLIEMKKA